MLLKHKSTELQRQLWQFTPQ